MKNDKAKKNKSSDSISERIYRFPLAYIILLASILVVYGQTLFFALGKLDETNIILENIGFLSNFHNLKEALFTDPFFHKGGDFYRPMQNLSFMIDAHLSGTSGWAYYLSNLLLHFITCSLLFYLLKFTGNNRKTSLLLVLIFAIHPLFVQTVAWAPSRGDLLMSMSGLLCFIFFIHYIRSGRLLHLLCSISAFAFAILSKETAVIIPVMCFLWYFFVEKENKISLARLAIPFAFYTALFAGFMIIRNYVVQINVPKGQFGLMPFIVHLRTIPEFIFKFFLPLDLGPMPAFGWMPTLTGLFLMAGLIWLAIRFRKGSGNIYLFGLAWFLLFTIPALMYINKFGSAACDYMEHRAYLPSVGILLFVSCLISRSSNLNTNKNVPVILIAILVFFGFYAHIYARNYKTPMSFYNLAISNNPSSGIAWFNRGATRMNFEKDYPAAIKDYEVSMKLYVNYAETYINRGFCREQLHDTLGAVADYETAARLKPSWYEPHVDLATIRRNMGLIKEAVQEYDTALTLLPSFYQGYNERGALLMQLGDHRSALEDFNKAISMNDKYPEAYFNRGLLEFRMEDYKSAMDDYNLALSMDKDYVEAWVNRGVLKYRIQDYQGSVADFSQALTLDDKYAEAYLDRGMARYMEKDLPGACEDWTVAKSFNLADAGALLQQYCQK